MKVKILKRNNALIFFFAAGIRSKANAYFVQNNRVNRNLLNSWAKLVVGACARALHFEILCNFVTRAFGSWVVVENGYFGKMTGKHGDTLKDRDTEGGRFRDVVINRGKFKSKLRWKGVGEGAKLMQIRQGHLFPILKFTHQCVFRARYRGLGELRERI